MLEHLFGSKTRSKLLVLFLHHPDEAFFVRELTRRIDTQINAVRRELDNLVKLGIVHAVEVPAEDSKRPGLKRKYYKMNDQFPLLGEIRTLVIKAHILMERRLDKEIAAIGDVYYLALMGSFIGRQGAPVDMFIVGTIDQDAMRTLVDGLQYDLGFEINFTCMTQQEYRYRKEVMDRFLGSILEAPKSIMINRLDRQEEGRKT